MSHRDFHPASLWTTCLMLLLAVGLNHSAPAQEPRSRDGEAAGDSKSAQREAGARLRPPERGDWVLGVTVRTLDVGVEIERIEPRSAAEQAGLERRDIIVAVSGYQVGRVEGRTYPLEQELQSRADERGRVRLLVQNRRNRELVNVDVQLQRAGAETPDRFVEIRGTATYRERIAAPRSGRLRVQLVERGGFLGSDRVLAEEEYRNVGNPPYDFALNVARRELEGRRRLEVRVSLLEAGGRVFMDGRESLDLGPGLTPRPVQVLLKPPR